MRKIAFVIACTGIACGKKHAPAMDDAARAIATVTDAGAPSAPDAPAAAPTPPWPELADLPEASPWKIVELPIADPAASDTTAGGPLIVDQIAIVATSRAGFVAVDLTTGAVLWSRRAGARVAPPLGRGDRAVLIGDCPPGPPPVLGPDDLALGCFDVVDPVHIADERAGVVHGARKALADFDRAAGPMLTALADDGSILWRRGEVVIRFDATTGSATLAQTTELTDHVDVTYSGARWTYTLEGDALSGAADGKTKWTTPTSAAVLIGAFNDTPPRIPTVRIAGRGHPRNAPTTNKLHGPGTAHDPPRPTRLLLLDMAGTDGALGSVSHSFPGAAAVASAFGAGGTTIVAVRLDDSNLRHYIAAFDGNGMPLWAWPLPEPPGATPRAAAPQVALSGDGWVVALFDDRLAIIPLVSEPPTPDLGPSRNPTP
jgi:outer membrane protein assembly factor BamB